MDMFAERLSQKAISDNPSESDKMSRRDDESDRGVKLFGVTIMKSVSTRNLSYNTQQDQASVGYVTDRFGHNLCKTARRNRGIPWTEEEHRLFLAGLEILGKGDWRGISRSFVRTRTPTQVASHAQKYYLRQRHSITDKRRSSVFDICPNHYIHDAENYRIVLASTTTNSKSRVGGIEEKRLSLSIASPYSCDHSPFYLRSNGWSMIRL